MQVWDGGFIGLDFVDLDFAVAVVADLEDCGDGRVSHSGGSHSVVWDSWAENWIAVKWHFDSGSS